MSKPSTEVKAQGFINASLVESRLISEQLTSTPIQAGKEPQKVQIRTEAGSNFSVGLDDMTKPSGMLVEIEFKVNLTIEGSDKVLAAYEAKHETRFRVSTWTGFEDWGSVPSGTFESHFSSVYSIAARRAEATFVEMGIRGIAIPRPENFEGSEQQSATNISADAE